MVSAGETRHRSNIVISRTSLRRVSRLTIAKQRPEVAARQWNGPPAGETPAECRGTRTRKAPGNETKRNGGTSSSASPSRPTATGALVRTSNSSDDHWRAAPKRRCRAIVPSVTEVLRLRRRRVPASRRCPAVPYRVAVVFLRRGTVAADMRRSQATRRYPSPLHAVVELELTAIRVPPHHVRQHLLPGPELGVAVGIGLHHPGINA